MTVPFTKEHGAYGMAITTFVIGSAIGGGFGIYTLSTIVGIILLIMAKYPIQMLFQKRSIDRKLKRRFVFWGLIFIYSGFLLLLPLFRNLSGRAVLLIIISPILHATFYFLTMLFKRDRTIFAEVLGISALSSSGVFGYYASGGEDVQLSMFIWMLALLYYTASIFKVRSLLMKEEKNFYRRLSFAYPIFCVIIVSGFAIINLIQFCVLFSLLPLAENILVQFRSGKIDIRRTGWIEVVKSAVFGIILTFTLRK